MLLIDDSLAIFQVLELLSGEDGAIGRALELIFNQAMILERERYLKASAYERSEERTGYANGFKPKSLKTRSGVLGVVEKRIYRLQ